MDNWDTLLPIATMAYNTVRQDTVGESPVYLMYGTNPRDSFSNWLNVEDEDETLEERLKRLDTTRRTAHDHVTKNQLKQKTQYDKHRRTTQFEDGDVVLFMYYNIIKLLVLRRNWSPLSRVITKLYHTTAINTE